MKNKGKKIGKNVAKNLRGKYSQELLDPTRKYVLQVYIVQTSHFCIHPPL